MSIQQTIYKHDVAQAHLPQDLRKGRGATSNMAGRFDAQARILFDDGWGTPVEDRVRKTEVLDETPRRILSKNSSPDVPFDVSINPYRGCEHGCSYCYARPSHAYMGLSPGLDFESRLFAKPDAAKLLQKEISAKNYKVSTIALGTNTDPYQPIERERKITRSILEVLVAAKHPFSIVTKNQLILRDIDLLRSAAEDNLVKVFMSITTLDHKLSRNMEPRATTPQRRLDTLRILGEHGVPTGALIAPIIPALNDHEIENILTACADMGVKEAAYILLRLPNEVAPIFQSWLEEYYPDRAGRVMSRLKAMRYGKVNDPRFGNRMRGNGVEAMMLSRRFRVTAERVGINSHDHKLDASHFLPPIRPKSDPQLCLF